MGDIVSSKMHMICSFHCGGCESKRADWAEAFTGVSRRYLGLYPVTGEIDRERPENGYRLEWTPSFLHRNSVRQSSVGFKLNRNYLVIVAPVTGTWDSSGSWTKELPDEWALGVSENSCYIACSCFLRP